MPTEFFIIEPEKKGKLFFNRFRVSPIMSVRWLKQYFSQHTKYRSTYQEFIEYYEAAFRRTLE